MHLGGNMSLKASFGSSEEEQFVGIFDKVTYSVGWRSLSDKF